MVKLLGVLLLLGWIPSANWAEPLVWSPAARHPLMELRVSTDAPPWLRESVRTARLDWCIRSEELCIDLRFVAPKDANVHAVDWLSKESGGVVYGRISWPAGDLSPPVLYLEESDQGPEHQRVVARHEMAHGLGAISGHPTNEGVLDSRFVWGNGPGESRYFITDDDVRSVLWFRRRALSRKENK